MNFLSRFLLIQLFCIIPHLNGSSTILKKLASSEARTIGEKIWYNESGKKLDYIAFWKDGEEFGSFGIGHVIWHPAQSKAPQFNNTFPSLITFMQTEGTRIPSWIVNACKTGCPWNNRKEFYAAQNSSQMKELKNFLINTIDLQVKFMVTRLELFLKRLPQYIPPRKRQHIEKQIQILAQTTQGMYILIDYLNFKGEGLSPQEHYKGKKWGLISVLKMMHATEPGNPAYAAFAQAAKIVLAERVAYAPKERNESRWLAGWFNRIDTYTQLT